MSDCRYRIIVINGPTSSGKSTTARELQKIAPNPFFHLSIDTFYSFLPERMHDDLGVIRSQLIPSMHRSVAAFAAIGCSVVLDHVLFEPAWYKDCREVFAPFPVLWVGLHCGLPTLEQRERKRGDRIRGLAQSQIERVHNHPGLQYDLEIHSDMVDPRAAAQMIWNRLTISEGNADISKAKNG